MDTLLAATAERRRAIAGLRRGRSSRTTVSRRSPSHRGGPASMVRAASATGRSSYRSPSATEALREARLRGADRGPARRPPPCRPRREVAVLAELVRRAAAAHPEERRRRRGVGGGVAARPSFRCGDWPIGGSPRSAILPRSRCWRPGWPRPTSRRKSEADILMAIGNAHTTGAADLVERHLADPAYDPWDFHDARSAAAWAARRIGGERMTRALRESAVRRDGRDWATLAYLAVVDKADAIPTLKTLRLKRLRCSRGAPRARGNPARADDPRSRGGRSPSKFDVPPETPRRALAQAVAGCRRRPRGAPLSDAARTSPAR